jgi:uncharacterized surface protein with fasciclin (FAS1) repeats
MKIKKYLNIGALCLSVSMIFTSCYERKTFPEPTTQLRTLGALVSDLRQAPGVRSFDPFFAHYSTFKAALEKTGLDAVLRDNSKKFVVFAPDNLAFEQLRAPFNNPDNIRLFIRGSVDALGNPVQPAYNDSIMLRTIMLNHIIEVVNNEEVSFGKQTSFSSLAVQQSFLPANNTLNTLWVNNSLTIKPATGVQGSLTFIAPTVNDIPMISWDTKGSNGVLNTVPAVLFPANTYEFLRVDGRYNSFRSALETLSDLAAYLSNPQTSATVFAPDVAVTINASTRVRVQHHILAASEGKVFGFTPTRLSTAFRPNLNSGRSTGFAFAGSPCGATIDVMVLVNDPQSAPVGTATVGVDPTGYGGCAAFALNGYIATTNGVVHNARGLLNP